MGFVDLWITSVEQYKHSNRLRIPTSRQHKVIELSTLRIFGTWLNLNLSFNEILTLRKRTLIRQPLSRSTSHASTSRVESNTPFTSPPGLHSIAISGDIGRTKELPWSTYKVKPSRKQCFCQRHIVKMNDQSHWLVPFTNVKGCQMMCI